MQNQAELEDKFVESVVPGNYWITKSMEFTKKEKSGTLWYLKKFLVFYYYLFFTNKFETKDGIAEIVSEIDYFINSLHLDVRETAQDFYYPENVNLKSGQYKDYSEFAHTSRMFINAEEKKKFILNVKKYYFMYLMGFGGQAGHKKVMKEILAITTSYEEFYSEAEKYFNNEGLDQAKKREMFADYPAAIRNERQIYFYYGFFHGKEANSLGGFYKFTPIGKAVVKANFDEILLIWEHQKLRMISQSPITEINNLDKLKRLSDVKKEEIIEKVDNLNHPYFILLSILQSRCSVDSMTYKYIVSRSKNYHSVEDIIKLSHITSKDSLIHKINDQLTPYNRTADGESEDFEKERKKYILGIQQLPLDQEKNYLAFLDREGEHLKDSDCADFVMSVYASVILYLDRFMSHIYASFSQYLKTYYAGQIAISGHLASGLNIEELKFNWYNYIINFDRTILALLIFVSIKLQKHKINRQLSKSDIDSAFNNYSYLTKAVLGIQSKKKFSEIIMLINNQYEDGNLDLNDVMSLHALLNEELSDDRVLHEEVILEATIEKLKEYSKDNLNRSIRERDTRIIYTMRAYYQNEFSNSSGLIECDSCGNKTFISVTGKAYLEFHHIIPFSIASGPDHYLNLTGICPLCHRKFHHLNLREKPTLYENFEHNNHLKKNLSQRLDGLYEDNALEPIHLNYLVVEGAIDKEKQMEILNRDIVISKI